MTRGNDQSTQGIWGQTPFANEGSFWMFAAFVLGTVSFLRGIRYPTAWAATQALIDYRYGLVKRGLFGATVGNWFHAERYFNFSMVSYLLLLTLMLLLGCLVRQSGAPTRLLSGQPVAVFFASYAVTYLGNDVGYLDIPLAILTVGLLLIRSPMIRAAIAFPVCIAGIFLHEMFLIVFLPVILFSFFLDSLASETSIAKKAAWFAMPLSLAALMATAKLALKRPLTDEQVLRMGNAVAGRADFNVDTNVFRVFSRSTSDNLQEMVGKYKTFAWLSEVGVYFVTFAVTMLMLLAAILIATRMVKQERRRKVVLLSALIAALSPFLMYLVGFDCGRWNMLVCLESFLVLLLLSRASTTVIDGFSANYRSASIVSIALGLASGGVLFGRRAENSFPFILNLVAWTHEVQRHGWVCSDCIHRP